MSDRKPAQTASSAPDAAPTGTALDLSGRTIADFKVLRKLGQGGMGQVYLAEQISLKRNVALKILRPEAASSPTALARFQAEAEAVARATHPNIVQVYAAGVTDDGLAYMALEFVEGRNLKEDLARKGSLDLPFALSIMRQVALALQRASELGITHRDIKPENILLTKRKEVKVADFGLARSLEGDDRPALNLTQTGVTMGTPLYMSPEQVEGKTVDPRTDIYSFGVTCYHMLSGEPPFVGDSPFEVAVQHVQKQPVPLSKKRPDLPEALCAIVHKMMAKSPADRYQTGKELLRDIARCRETLSSTVANTLVGQPALSTDQPTVLARTPTETATTALPTPRKSRRGLLVGAMVLTIVAAAFGGAVFAWKEQQRQGLMPHGQEIAPADASALDQIALPSKQEQTLRDAAEQYLSRPDRKSTELAGGFGVCMDLGLYYLDHHRFDEADKLFSRLEAFKEPASYRALGQVGKGIVLALKNEAKESNRYFGILPVKGGGLGKDKGGFLKRLEKEAPQLATLFHNPRWRYWISRARWYNSKNGLPESNVPQWMRGQFPIKDGMFEPPPADKDKAPPKDKEKPPPKEKDKSVPPKDKPSPPREKDKLT
jgi:serine/threonine protein kinase